MDIRTDFADELINKGKQEEYIKHSKTLKGVKQTVIEIIKEKNQFNKEKGKYISIDFNNLYDENDRINITNMLITSLKELHKVKQNSKVLIVGLGNSKIIADSLGPNVADKVIVTNHLFKVIPDDIEKDMNKVCVLTPKVMGQTGLESADIVEAVSDLFKPDLVIVIDALASSSIKRVNKVIQLSDTGIAPGSGVGNYRKEITQRKLNAKVIAIGVATVVEASNIVSEMIGKNIEDSHLNLILTPKEIDEDIEHLSTIIATSINKYIHKDANKM